MEGWFNPGPDPFPTPPDRMDRFTDAWGGPSVWSPSKGDVVRHAHSDAEGRLLVLHEHVDGHLEHKHEDGE